MCVFELIKYNGYNVEFKRVKHKSVSSVTEIFIRKFPIF